MNSFTFQMRKGVKESAANKSVRLGKTASSSHQTRGQKLIISLGYDCETKATVNTQPGNYCISFGC